MNKLRSDSAFCQLTPEQVDVLEGWLFEERIGYPKVLEKLKAEFGLETSLTALRRFYKRLEMERSRVSLMDAVEMGGLAVEALKSGTLKPGMLALANKCAVELMMQSPPPVREVTALLRAITSAEGHAMKQTVFEREENERREAERVKKARESWRLTPQDIEDEKEELRQERAAKRKAKQAAAERAAKEREDSGVAEAKAEGGCAEPLPTPVPGMDEKNKICCIENARPHPNPMASQARHLSVAQKETCASRKVVPQEREKNRHSHASGVQGAISLSGDSNPAISPLRREGEEKVADQADSPVTKEAGGVWQPSVLEEREYAENYPAEEAENRLTPLNAA